LVKKLAGSSLARERMQLILKTIAGEYRVQDACEHLGISQQRFERLRKRAIKAGIAALEPKPAGRPAKVLTESESENIRLRQRIAELEAELKITHIRLELQTELPRLGAATKKSSPRSGRTRKSRQSRSRPGNTSKP
jgi:transposase